ncbi:nucleoside-diphosphate sugar epimerase/dehydratase, partial [Ornithinimicrobium pekingense]
MVRSVWILTDGACWAVAVLVSILARASLEPSFMTTPTPWILAGLAATLHIVVGIVGGPYMVRHMRGSFDEVTGVVKAALITGLLFIAVAWLTQDIGVPRSVALFAPAVAIVNMLAIRFVVRSYRSRRMARNPDGEPVVVLGAGLAGRR